MDTENLWNIFDDLKKLKKEEIKEDKKVGETDFIADFCKYCKTNSLEYEDGNYFCNICGIMQQKKLSHNAEYRFYGDVDNKSTNPERVGMPTNILLPKSSLGSLIGYRKYDNNNFKKMVQYNSWNAMPYKERSQWKIFSLITTKANAGGLPKIIIEDAKTYYKTIDETSITRGNNRQGIIAACVYVACKKNNVPRSSKEIACIFGINLHDVTKGYKKFKQIWRLKKDNKKIRNTTANPLDYIDRFCSNLQLSLDLKYIAEFVAVKALSCLDNLVEDNTSPSVAAGAIFLVCDECKQNINKKQVAIACKTSEVTISKCHKKLKKHRLKLFPKKVIIQYNID